jgi:hypothetical protein
LSGKIFPTAQDAENAFYEALGAATSGHDGRLGGGRRPRVRAPDRRAAQPDEVRQSWSASSPPGARPRDDRAAIGATGMLSRFWRVRRFVSAGKARAAIAPIVATNVYLRTAAGWRMIVHHGSPAPVQAEPPRETPKILH